MLLLSYIRWAKDPSRPPAETDVPKFLLDAILGTIHKILDLRPLNACYVH